MTLDVQLYTLRNFITTIDGFRDALQRVAALGYDGVQLSAVGCMNGDAPTLDAAGARALLDEFGLQATATHRAWDRLRDHTDEEIAFHQTLGCRYAAIGGIWAPEGQTFESALTQWLSELPPVLDRLSAAGIQFGYHNHHHEFERIGAANETVYARLIREADPRLQFEVDTYWVAMGGASVERQLESLSERIPMIHVKDMAVVDRKSGVMAPVGEGNLDWDHILSAARRGGTTAFIVEQDECLRDPFDCLASSYRFLRSRLTA